MCHVEVFQTNKISLKNVFFSFSHAMHPFVVGLHIKWKSKRAFDTENLNI